MNRFLVSIACLATVFTGCSEKQIAIQRVPAKESSYKSFREQQTDPQTTNDSAKKEPRRMIVGMFDQPKATWFFKANGNQEVINDHQEQILELLRGVTFEQDEPKWKLPEGWTVGPKKTSMFAPLATLVIDADTNTQLTVSSLSPNQDLLANANRWRGQLGLDPLTQDQIATEFPKAEGEDFYLFDAVGTGSGKMAGGKAPFANAPFLQQQAMQAKRDAAKAKQSPSQRPPQSSGLNYDVPEGWSEKQTTGMVPATRITKKTTTDSDQTVMITFTRMSSAVNNWPDNAQRWAGQVQQTFTADELTKATEDFKIGDQPSQLIELLDGNSEQAIVAVMTVDDQNAWFFKLVGDKETVRQELPTFRKLLNSIKFK